MKTRKTIAVSLAVVMFLGITGSLAQAAIIYQQPFDTDVATNALFDSTYGFTHTQSWTVTGGVATAGGAQNPDFLYRTMPAYDWSAPLTISADLGALTGVGGQSLGVFFGTGGNPNNAGISYCLFWPSTTHGGFVGESDGYPRPFQNNTDVNPDVVVDATGATRYALALTIRQNLSNTSDFDWRVTIDGIEQFGGWNTDAKGSYLASPLTTFGIRGDNVRATLDNLKVELETAGPSDDIPEPATMALCALGACGLGGYVRRRRTA